MMRIFDVWRLLPQRIALHEPTATAVMSDVHLGYCAARQRQGDAIPSRSVREELAPLIDAAQQNEIRSLLVAGDLFERGFDAALHVAFLNVLHTLKIELIGLTPGNHDRGATSMPLFAEGYDLAGWHIVHGDQAWEGDRVICGHWHPALRRRGRKQPCFLVNGERLILPAFSLDAAGVDVARNPRWRDWRRLAIDGQSIRATK